MQAYILRRLLVAIPVIFLVSLAVFSLVRVLPGDALLALTAEAGFVGEEAEEELRAALGLDKSYFAQYASWMGGIFQGDLGVSLLRNETVAGQLRRAIPVTVQLAIMTILLTIAHRRSHRDNLRHPARLHTRLRREDGEHHRPFDPRFLGSHPRDRLRRHLVQVVPANYP